MVAHSTAKNCNVTQASYYFLLPQAEKGCFSKFSTCLSGYLQKMSENAQIPTQTKTTRQQTHYISEEVRTRNNQVPQPPLPFLLPKSDERGRKDRTPNPGGYTLIPQRFPQSLQISVSNYLRTNLVCAPGLKTAPKSFHIMATLYVCQHTLPPRMCREAKGHETFAYYLKVQGFRQT